MEQKSVVLTLQQKDVHEIVKALIHNEGTENMQMRKMFVGTYWNLLNINDPTSYIEVKVTYNDLSVILESMEKRLFAKKEDFPDSEAKKVYYSLVNIWGNNAKKDETEDETEYEAEYEIFKIKWMLDHGHTLRELLEELQEIQEECGCDIIEAFHTFEDEEGFSQEIYPSYAEWLVNEKKEDN